MYYKCKLILLGVRPTVNLAYLIMLVSIVFNVLANLSTRPLPCGWYVVEGSCLIQWLLMKFWNFADKKIDPRSEMASKTARRIVLLGI